MLRRKDLPNMRLVGVQFHPPQPPPEWSLGGNIRGGIPVSHFIAEFDWPGLGTVVAETAEGVWITKESYYERTKAIAYVSYTPEEVSEVLGGPLWDSVPVERQIWTFDRLNLECQLFAREYRVTKGLLGRYPWDDSIHWTEMYWTARQLGIEKRAALAPSRALSTATQLSRLRR